MLVLLAALLTGIGCWLLQSAFFEAWSKVAPQFQDPFTVQFAVDPYIWSPAASRPLRRRYVMAHAILIVALILWAMVAWTNGAHPLSIILTVMAAGIAGLLTWRSTQRGL